MNRTMAFFDIDCFKLLSNRKTPALMKNVAQLDDKLDLLYSFAEGKNIRIIFTTDNSDQSIKPGDAGHALFIPADPMETGWVKELKKSRLIYLEKRTSVKPGKKEQNVLDDIFKNNGNAYRLTRELNVPNWVLFGNVAGLNISLVAKGISFAGFDVTVLSDVLISGAKNKAKSIRKSIKDIKQTGARIETISDFLNEQRFDFSSRKRNRPVF